MMIGTGRDTTTVELDVYHITDSIEQLKAFFSKLQVAPLLFGEFLIAVFSHIVLLLCFHCKDRHERYKQALQNRTSYHCNLLLYRALLLTYLPLLTNLFIKAEKRLLGCPPTDNLPIRKAICTIQNKSFHQPYCLKISLYRYFCSKNSYTFRLCFRI